MSNRVLVLYGVDLNNVSDGVHSMGELYDHRCHLFVKLMRAYPEISWRAKEPGSKDHFLAGMELPTGQVTYHMPMSMWTFLDESGIRTPKIPPKWDGHGSQDVLRRLGEWENSVGL